MAETAIVLVYERTLPFLTASSTDPAVVVPLYQWIKSQPGLWQLFELALAAHEPDGARLDELALRIVIRQGRPAPILRWSATTAATKQALRDWIDSQPLLRGLADRAAAISDTAATR